MAQSTLALGFTEFSAEVGRYLGYGSSSSSWTADQTTEITRLVNAGVRRFYNPPIVPPDPTPHRWSFLAPTYSFNTTASDYDYDLPDGYGEIDGPIHYDNAETARHQIELTSPERLLMLRGRDTATGFPQYAAVRPKAQTSGTFQIWELLLWPTPSDTLTLHLSYFRQVDQLSASNPYPYGGAVHSETIMASCLAEAERRFNDESSIHKVDFMERLAVSIAQDRRAHESSTLGYNGPRTWRKNAGGHTLRSYGATLTLDGGAFP